MEKVTEEKMRMKKLRDETIELMKYFLATLSVPFVAKAVLNEWGALIIFLSVAVTVFGVAALFALNEGTAGYIGALVLGLFYGILLSFIIYDPEVDVALAVLPLAVFCLVVMLSNRPELRANRGQIAVYPIIIFAKTEDSFEQLGRESQIKEVEGVAVSDYTVGDLFEDVSKVAWKTNQRSDVGCETKARIRVSEYWDDRESPVFGPICPSPEAEDHFESMRYVWKIQKLFGIFSMLTALVLIARRAIWLIAVYPSYTAVEGAYGPVIAVVCAVIAICFYLRRRERAILLLGIFWMLVSWLLPVPGILDFSLSILGVVLAAMSRIGPSEKGYAFYFLYVETSNAPAIMTSAWKSPRLVKRTLPYVERRRVLRDILLENQEVEIMREVEEGTSEQRLCLSEFICQLECCKELYECFLERSNRVLSLGIDRRSRR